MRMEHSATIEDGQAIVERQQADSPTCQKEAVEQDSLHDLLWSEAQANVILQRAAEDPEAQLHREQLQQKNCPRADFDELVCQHRSEVLLPRAISWFCALDDATRVRLVKEALQAIHQLFSGSQERQYWASVKCCRVFNGVTEFRYENGSVELFDSYEN